MIGLGKHVLASVLFILCVISASPRMPAQDIQALKPDEGTPPQPAVAQSQRVPTREEQLGRIATLFAERCLTCHGAEQPEGNYSLATFAALRVSGDSNKRPVMDGAPDASELYRRLVTDDASERMPAESESLSQEELAMIRAWIADGAAVPADLAQRPLAEWPRMKAPHSATGRPYPTALPIAAVTLARDGQSIWTSGYGEVLQWDLASGRLVARRTVAGTQVADIELSHDGRYLAVSSGTPGTQGVVQVWNTSQLDSLAAHWSEASADVPADIAFAPASARLAIGRADGSLMLVDMESHTSEAQASVSTFTPHADAVLCVAWSESGDRLISGSRDRTAKIFDGRTLDLIANYDRHQRAVGGVAYAGPHPVSLDETGQLRLWAGDDSDRTISEQSGLPRFLERLASRGDQILLADENHVRVIRMEKKQTEDGKDDAGKPKMKTTTRWREETPLQAEGSHWIMALSCQDALLAAGTEAGEVIVWEADVPQPKFRFLAKP